MKLSNFPSKRQAGFTLVELSVGMLMAMAIAASLVAVVSHQVTLTRVINQQSFLRDEAPQMNLLLTRIFESASSYRIYASRADAFNGTSAVNVGGRAVRLRFRQPDGTLEESVLSFDLVGGEGELNFYSESDGNWSTTPNWTVSQQPELVTFENDTGVLLVTMTGPEQEEITYVGR